MEISYDVEKKQKKKESIDVLLHVVRDYSSWSNEFMWQLNAVDG